MLSLGDRPGVCKPFWASSNVSEVRRLLLLRRIAATILSDAILAGVRSFDACGPLPTSDVVQLVVAP